MASVQRRTTRGRTYHVLVQTYRWEGKVRSKEVYLGAKVPADLTTLRRRLDDAVCSATWYPYFDRIREAYARRSSKIPESVVHEERDDFIARFTYDSNRIEGSTLSLQDTRRVIAGRSPRAELPIGDVLEARNHALLLRRLVDDAGRLDLQTLLEWHRELFEQTKPDIAGRLRDFEVRIGGSAHRPPTAIEVRPMLLELLRKTARGRGTTHTVRSAAEFHARFEAIHPFGDGNGRLGRLGMNVILAQDGFPMLNITHGHRAGYYRALEASQGGNGTRPFVAWFFLRYAREHRYLVGEGNDRTGRVERTKHPSRSRVAHTVVSARMPARTRED